MPRILPLAISANTSGLRSPAIIAARITLAETVVNDDATEESLMLAS